MLFDRLKAKSDAIRIDSVLGFRNRRFVVREPHTCRHASPVFPDTRRLADTRLVMDDEFLIEDADEDERVLI